jgi:hypothetical protein
VPELTGAVAGGLFGLLAAGTEAEPAVTWLIIGDDAGEPAAALSSSAASGSSFAQAALHNRPHIEIETTREARLMTFILRLAHPVPQTR